VINGDYPEFFEKLFAGFPEIEMETFDLAAGEFPGDLDRCEGWISSGSRESVYDDIPWVRQLADLVRTLDAEHRKFVGICFGAQMIGHALGGEVRRADQGWQVGIKKVNVTESTAWMDPGASSFSILHGNADQIVRTPPRMRVIGSSDTVPVSVVAVEDHMIGFQGHPEFTPAYSSVLMEGRRGTLIPDGVVDAGLASLDREPDTDLLASWILRFLAT
jgi:GMP synthase-like glutamine amidotransferase